MEHLEPTHLIQSWPQHNHWVLRTLDNTRTCLTTKPSGMGRCKLMSTEPIFGNKTLKPLIGLSLNWGNTKDLNWPYFLRLSGRSIYPPSSSAKQSSLWVGAKRNCKPLGTSQVIGAFQSAQSHLDRFSRCSSLSA